MCDYFSIVDQNLSFAFSFAGLSGNSIAIMFDIIEAKRCSFAYASTFLQFFFVLYVHCYERIGPSVKLLKALNLHDSQHLYVQTSRCIHNTPHCVIGFLHSTYAMNTFRTVAYLQQTKRKSGSIHTKRNVQETHAWLMSTSSIQCERQST